MDATAQSLPSPTVLIVVDDDISCYRHPSAVAAVGCQRCDRPICTDCMRSASVGYHCPECTKAGAQRVYTASDLQSRPLFVFVLIGLCVAAYFAQQAATPESSIDLTTDGILWGRFVADGEVWRLVTSGFLHGSLMHLGFNMFALYLFGPMLEQALGWVRTLLIYAGGLVGGGAAVLWFNWDAPTLGASGAVLGLAGGLAAALWARGIPITQTSLGGIFLMNLALPLLVPRISFWGHFGGIAGGFIVGWLLTWLPGRLGQSETAGVVAAVGAVVAMTALAILGAEVGAT